MAVVQVNENTLDFIFDSNTNYYELHNLNVLLELKENTEIYYYNENDILVNTNYSYKKDDELGFGAGNIENDTCIVGFSTKSFNFGKFNQDIIEEGLTIKKNQWYLNLDTGIVIKTKGFRVINFEYSFKQNINTINTLVNPYIGTKTSFAKTYTLRVNGKLLNTINGKKIRNLIYNGTTYEIA